ncbi:glycosyltransferase family 9 protein [Pontimicrobium sp. MEBiC01747]
MPKPKHILVIRLSAMGDVAMTVPVLRALTSQYPEVKLTVLTRAFFKPFFRDLPNTSIYEADLKGRHKGILGIFKLSKELKALKIDAIVDLHNVLRTKLLKFFLFGKVFKQIDKGRAEKKLLVKGEIFKQLKTTHERYVDVFKEIGYFIDLSKKTDIRTNKINDTALKLIGNNTKKWIGIAPFAQYKSKMYPLDLLESVIKNLSENYKILLFGGGINEEEKLNKFQNKYRNVVNLAGKFNLNEELNIISNLDVMLAMDSGNAHIAAMLGVKVITIWNVTHPYAGFAPFAQPEQHQILPDRTKYPLIPTSIYGNKYPDDYEDAARTITPETIIQRLESII